MEGTGWRSTRVVALALNSLVAATQVCFAEPPRIYLVAGAEADFISPAVTAAAKCKQTVQRFVRDLDALMAESPRSLDRYNSLLAWYFPETKSFGSGPVFSMTGCDVNELIGVVRHSRFLHEIGRPPQYANYRIEFRGSVAKVFMSIDPNTGNIMHVGAWWIQSPI